MPNVQLNLIICSGMLDYMSENKETMYLFQYVLDNQVGIVRDELYEYLIIRTMYDCNDQHFTDQNILYAIEKNYQLDNFPDIHFKSALERLIKKKKITKNTEFMLSDNIKREIHENNQKYLELIKNISADLKKLLIDNIPELSSLMADSIVENFFKLLGKTFRIHGKVLSRMIVEQNIGKIQSSYCPSNPPEDIRVNIKFKSYSPQVFGEAFL